MASSPTSREPDFGIFEPMFESAHGYLALLHLSFSDAGEAVELVRHCCRKVSNPYQDICRLLADPNWRPHLVAAVAAIVSGYDANAVKHLWHRVDSGSWVTPQIGAALFLIDPDFESQCRSRLESACPIEVTDLIAMTPVERHSAAGPGGTADRSAKSACTLIQLLKLRQPVPEWVHPLADSKKLQEMVAGDIDGSSAIAENWLCRIKEITS